MVTLKGDTSRHYNMHIMPSGQQTVDAEKGGRWGDIFQKIPHIMRDKLK